MVVRGVITEEGLAELRSRIGVSLRPRERLNEVASKDAIKRFALGLGDRNPLWVDEEYARSTRWGGIIAPPCFLYSTGGYSGAGGLPGVHGIYAGDEWEFYLPVRLNDRIHVTGQLLDVIEKQGEFAGRQVFTITESVYRNQNDEVVGRRKQFHMRTQRHTARERGKYSEIKPHHYSEEEIKAIEADYDREEIRGATPRYWEDVQVGDELTPVVKGPLRVTDIIAWVMGEGTPYIRAHAFGLEYRRRHPAVGIPNESGVPDVPERVHWDQDFARSVGAPGAYDYGPQRVSFVSHLLTNWMGDDGWLKWIKVEIRRFNILGDTTWIKGKATNKYVKDGEHLVECEVWAENQRGEITAPGSATVALPSRSQP